MGAPEIVIPARDWGEDDEAAPVAPTVLISSRDGYGDPGAEVVDNRRAAWRGLGKRAERAGWVVRFAYALAHVPDQFWKHGGLRRAAHYVHTVSIRLARGRERAVAVWRREHDAPSMPADGWSCGMAAVGASFMGLREFSAVVTP